MSEVIDRPIGTARRRDALVSDLTGMDYAITRGADLQSVLALSDDDILRFSGYWDGLTLDRFMGDKGRYRFRRYSALTIERADTPPVLLPHAPYEQSSNVNPLNGGIKREFDPVEPGFLASPVLTGLLAYLTASYNAVEGREAPWTVRLHPYRIRADVEAVGKPAPEGLHRDGVDFVLSLMIRRHNVIGGESSVATLDRDVLARHTLQDPLDMLVCNDRRVMHGVTDVYRIDPDQSAWRDVLVIAFSRR